MKKLISVIGMSCNHCKSAVEGVLTSIDGVKSVSVNLKKGNAVITSDNEINNGIIREKIESAGFKVDKIEIKKGLFVQ